MPESSVSRPPCEADSVSDQEWWRALFAQASDGILIADAECRFTDVNEAGCALLRRTHEQIVRLDMAALVAPAEAARVPLVKAELRQGQSCVGEWTLLRGDGSALAVEASARMLSDGRCLMLMRDITERRQRLHAAQAMAEELERRVALRTAQLRKLAAELEAAENRERRQIARDLHDDLGQTLAAVRIRLAVLCRNPDPQVRGAAEEIARLVEQANRSTRSLAGQLSPAVLYELGLVPALEWLAEEIERSFGLKVVVDDDGAPKPLSQEARSIVFRAVRELLINVAKHAGAAQARVRLVRRGPQLHVTVSDAGVGFHAAATDAAATRRGLGLASVRERLSFIGGSFRLHSIPGDGTQATLRLPLEPAPPGRHGAPGEAGGHHHRDRP